MQAILTSSRWRVIDRQPATIFSAIELVKVNRVPFWDALIGACMLEHGIGAIVTCHADCRQPKMEKWDCFEFGEKR